MSTHKNPHVQIFESSKNIYAFQTEINNWIKEYLGWRHEILFISQSTYIAPSFWWWKKEVVTVVTILYRNIE